MDPRFGLPVLAVLWACHDITPGRKSAITQRVKQKSPAHSNPNLELQT